MKKKALIPKKSIGILLALLLVIPAGSLTALAHEKADGNEFTEASHSSDAASIDQANAYPSTEERVIDSDNGRDLPDSNLPEKDEESEVKANDDKEAGLDSVEASESDQNASELLPARADFEYDKQPESLEDVQGAIDAFIAEVLRLLEEGDPDPYVRKPMWEFEVNALFMPEGYHCQFIEAEDELNEFDVDYYTFFVDTSTADWFGSGTEDDPYLITTEQHLRDLATNVNSGNRYNDTYFEMTNDIDVSSANWVSIGKQATTGLGSAPQRPFAGEFDGKSFSIRGLWGSNSGSDSNTGYGLFGAVTGKVSNLTVELGGPLSNTLFYTGIMTGVLYGGTIANCNVIGNGHLVTGTTDASGSGCAGIAGHADRGATIEGCNVTDVNMTAAVEVAGIVGRVARETAAGGNVVIRDCAVRNGTFTVTGGGYAAGLVGILAGYSTNNANRLENCQAYNVTTKTNGNYSAGLVGAVRYSYVNDCSAFNSSHEAGSYAGGAFGVVYIGAQVSSCSVENALVTGNTNESYIGGFTGTAYDNSVVESCSANNTEVNGKRYVGGFAGASLNASRITNSYAAGGLVTVGLVQGGTSRPTIGGFSGVHYDSSSITNCYAQVDVFNYTTDTETHYLKGVGGFVGAKYGASTVRNCYATGAVNAGVFPQSGSFVGRHQDSGTISNSFASGSLLGTGSSRGGFAGHITTANRITNCFYDTTTTRMVASNSIGSGNATQNVQGLTTTDMTSIDTFAAWGAQENFLGKAQGSASAANPWYIDDEITYPYLYFQYDGHSKAETNYFLSATTYSNGDGLGQKRSDFEVRQNSLPLQTKSAGAAKAWMPYSGTSLYDINRSNYTQIPGASFDASLLHSLAGVSQTNIVAFSGAPYAEKSSSRATWDVNDESTYTYVGDTITYYLTVWNYDSESDLREVTVTDDIHEGLTLLTDSITVNSGEDYDPGASDFEILSTGTTGKPYYSYDETTRKLAYHLNDMEKINPDTGDISSYTLSFKVFVEKDAQSQFSDQTTYVGDIENFATLSGELWYEGAQTGTDYSYLFGDENRDPVYDACVFTFIKEGSSSEALLEGARFSAYFWTGSGTPTTLVSTSTITTDASVPDKWYLTSQAVTDSDGVAKLILGRSPTFYPGYYQLVEDVAPTGYLKPDGQWELQVNTVGYVDAIRTVQSAEPEAVIALDFSTTTKDISISGTIYTVIDEARLGNIPSNGSIKIVKYGKANVALEGAAFSIERKEADGTWTPLAYDASQGWTPSTAGAYAQQTVIQSGDTDATTIFADLPIGTYRLTEEYVPSDYATLPGTFEGIIPTQNPLLPGEYHYNITFTVYNDKAYSIPTSGSVLTPALICVMGLVLVILAAFIWARRRGVVFWNAK